MPQEESNNKMSFEEKLGMLSSQESPSSQESGDDVPVAEASFVHSEVHALAKTHLDFLAALAMPTIISFGFPPVFLAVWQWLISYIHLSRDFSKLALGLPRGFGKTTLVKLFILYVILFTKRKFILVTAATEKLAVNIIADICDMLDEPNIKKVFGDWRVGIENDTQTLKKFGFRGRNIIIVGIGQGGSLRGLNLKNERPDVMIFEDIQTREDAESRVTSEGIERWMLGTAMKAKSPAGCLYIFVANMYPTQFSLLRKLKHNPSWTKFIAGGILSDGTSLWEQLQPINQLVEEFENDLNSGHPEIFYSEVLNDENASMNTAIDLSRIPPYPFDDHEVSAGGYIIIDPATDKLGADDVSIGRYEIINGKPVLCELECGRFSPGDTIRKTLTMCITHNLTLIAVESNAYQYSLLYWFTFICEQMGITGIECVPIYSGTRSKNSRILEMFKELSAGDILIHPDARAQVYMQITQFNPLKTNNTDGILDLLTYANRVLSEFGHFISINSPISAHYDDFENAKVWEEQENSPF
jgi:hypothetical protein